MQSLTPVGLLPCQVETLKELVEKAITQEYAAKGFIEQDLTEEDIDNLRYLIKMNRNLCQAGGLEETDSKIYRRCLDLTGL